jgi:diacylglycerol O-acyltransferase / wax synthase
LMAGVGLNITVVSYLDEVAFGLLACPEVVPGVDEIAAAVPEAHSELLKLARDR